MSCNFILPGGYLWPDLNSVVPRPSDVRGSVPEPGQPTISQMPSSFSLPRFSDTLSGVLPTIAYTSPSLTLPTLSDILIPVYSRLSVPSINFDQPGELNIKIPDFTIGDFRVDFLRPMYVVMPDGIRFSRFNVLIPDGSFEIDFTELVRSFDERELPVFRNVLDELGIPVRFESFSFSGDIFEKLGVRVGYLDMKFRRFFELVDGFLRSVDKSLFFRQIGERLSNYLTLEKVRLAGYESRVKSWLVLLKMYQRAYFENLGSYLKKLDAFMRTEGMRFTMYLKNISSELGEWRANMDLIEFVNKVNLKANAQNLEIIKNIIVLDGVYRELLNDLLVIYNAFIEIDILREQLALLLLRREEVYRERTIVLQEESILDEERNLLLEEMNLRNIEHSTLSERYALLLRIIDSHIESLRAKSDVIQAKFAESLISGDVANINAESQEIALELEAKETYYSFLFRILERYFSLVKEVYSVNKGVDLTNLRLSLLYKELSRELQRLLAWYNIYLRGVLYEMYSDED